MSEQPFLCVDLTFIAGMLHHGYRLAADAKLGTVLCHPFPNRVFDIDFGSDKLY
jgi:hypothetical protein